MDISSYKDTWRTITESWAKQDTAFAWCGAVRMSSPPYSPNSINAIDVRRVTIECLLVHWSVSPLVHWSIGPLVHWLNVKFQKSNVKYRMPNVNKSKLLSERISGAPPVIFLKSKWLLSKSKRVSTKCRSFLTMSKSAKEVTSQVWTLFFNFDFSGDACPRC